MCPKLCCSSVHIAYIFVWLVLFNLHIVAAQEIIAATNREEKIPLWVAPVTWKGKVPISQVLVVLGVFVIFIVLLGIAAFYIYRCLNRNNGHQVVGLRPQQVESFPLLTFPTEEGVGFGSTECPLCIEDFVQGDNIRVLPICNHIFHPQCIKLWLTSKSTKCPICRHDYVSWQPNEPLPDVP